MDRDFDEKLTFEEFMGEESHIEKVFKSMDKNGDGFVTKEEFQGVCKNLSDEQVMLLSYSKTKRNRIFYYLLLSRCVSHYQVEIAFKQFDTSGDDKLNYREFCEMIIKREQER